MKVKLRSKSKYFSENTEREKMCFYYRVATSGAIYHTNIGPYHKPDGADPIENFIRICASHFNRIFRTSLHPYGEITVVEFSQVDGITLFRKTTF